MHLSALANIPTIGLFGPSDSIKYHPWGSKTLAIKSPKSPEQLMGYKEFNSKVNSLMGDLSVKSVLQETIKFLKLMSNLSILIVVHNEERQLKDCLETISFADELIIILDKCTDNSEKIARKFSNKIFSGSWNIEGDRRNFGISKCKSNWIFEIDADERVPKELKSEILEIVKKSKSDWHMIGVNNYLGDKLIKFGWGAYIGKSSYAGLFRKKKSLG